VLRHIVEAIHAVANGEEYLYTVREKYLILQQNNSKLNKHNPIIESLLTGREIENYFNCL
jgi:DNA-binding NarL/FixJ family response regulator